MSFFKKGAVMKKNSWPRGSEWRKWDLHIHAPRTKLSDRYVANDGDVWDEYCQRLHHSDVRAFGIADYFSYDGFFSTVAKFKERYPDSDKVFFPNIELRITDVVNKAKEEVNIHLIFNPFRPDHEKQIRAFLQALKTSKTASTSGRNVRASELESQSQFESATTTRAFIQEALDETYGKNADLLDYVLIITAANNDGIRSERGKKRKALITDEIDKFSDAFFGNAGNVEYFLKNDRAEDRAELTKPKAVLSGCDAHSFSELDERLGQVFADKSAGVSLEPTWIKADLTFEGLKQIIFEPQNRVYIGKEPEVERRVRENKTRYIESVCISCVAGYDHQHGAWFCEEHIPFSKELTAIIGNKGSGKSALTDIIGLLGNSHNQMRTTMMGKPEVLFSFLNREKFLKGGCATCFQADLHWYDGAPDSKLLNGQVAPHQPERVEYLPQKYLERICSNISDEEFRSTLNEVIFRYVKPQNRFEKTNLEDLIQYLSQQAQEDITLKRQELHAANVQVVSMEKNLTVDYRRKIEENIKLKQQELEAHSKEKPAEKENPETSAEKTSPETEEIGKITECITELSKKIEPLERERVDLSQAAEELGQIRQAIERQTNLLAGLEAKYRNILNSSGLSFDKIVKIAVDFSPLDGVISSIRQKISQIKSLLLTDEEIAEIDDDDEKQRTKTISLVHRRASLEKDRAGLVDRLGKSARDYQQYLEDLKSWTDREKELRGDDEHPNADTLRGLQEELQRVKEIYPESLRASRADRERISKEIFDKQLSLTEFHKTVKLSIDAEIAKCRSDLGIYDISIEAGLRLKSDFIDDFLSFIDQGVSGSFIGRNEGRATLSRLLDFVTDWENKSQVFAALGKIDEAMHFDTRPEISPSNPVRDVFRQMKGQKTVQDLYDYLFGFHYLVPKYDLKVDQKDLSELSPGERGGLLLIFYLMLDKQDIPLVIDQPEDNLDNKSVYETLVTFIKQAKKRRQIILVTHNPNLAVVADAEQIIHVSIDKKDGKNEFDFFSGSIEAPHVNPAVVDILEGTLPAFDNRRLKYRKQQGRTVLDAPIARRDVETNH